MKKLIVGLCVFLGVTIFSAPPLIAQTVRPTGDGQWYYSIGGGDPMMYYRQSNKTNLSLSAGVDWNMMRGCSFDPTFGISETFSDMKNNIYGIAEDVINSAVAVASGWALSKVRENWPGQYDTIMNGLKDAKESYTLSLKTCRDVKADIRSGNNPVDGWYSVTRKSSWDKASARGDNPVTAEKDIEENAGNDGVTWIDGQKVGGRNADGTLQPPIRTVADTVTTGYSHLANETDPDSPDSITRVFATAEAAATWTTAVVGEREVRTCTGCSRLRTKVGQGLRYQYKKEREVVDDRLRDILNKPKVSVDDLDDLSVPNMGVVINENTVRNLRHAPADERAILTSRLSAEIALARAMEKALLARDLMNVGSQEPNISAVGDVALSEIKVSRERLQAEIDNILFETDVRKKVLNNAAGTIAERGSARAYDPAAINFMLPKSQAPRMQDGAIRDE